MENISWHGRNTRENGEHIMIHNGSYYFETNTIYKTQKCYSTILRINTLFDLKKKILRRLRTDV